VIGKAMTDFRSDSGSVVGFKSGSPMGVEGGLQW